MKMSYERQALFDEVAEFEEKRRCTIYRQDANNARSELGTTPTKYGLAPYVQRALLANNLGAISPWLKQHVFNGGILTSHLLLNGFINAFRPELYTKIPISYCGDWV